MVDRLPGMDAQMLTARVPKLTADGVIDKFLEGIKARGIEKLAAELAEIADETLTSEGDPAAYEREMTTLRERFAARLRVTYSST